eukprot:NODE_2813_length_1084_cov_43.240334_g2683_i0.p1 GENE.NODE_2813_length_1084_cov_43.240334_g2683_i0~~NODE_2813_length_1084_cov_43.240334_g2683_i0.p1  ORF type:complete len:324 (-),score=64.52 NODE_2813_length_1084_cov_43.240334_g2683_i0:59-1030(-)
MNSSFRLSMLLKTQLRLYSTPQPAILNRAMGQHQWYIHMSRIENSKTEEIASALAKLRKDSQAKNANLVLAFGPDFLAKVTSDQPEDFQPFKAIKSIDGSNREAKATQEDLVIWLNSDRKDDIWKLQWDCRQALKNHMKVARETITFIYGDSLDMTGFKDGTGNPEATRDTEVAIVPAGQKGAGGSFMLAQRWIHDLTAWEALPVGEQEKIFGRTKKDSTRLNEQPDFSHLSHTELREGATADATKPKRDEITRRSTPYAFHDGSVGLYFTAFCKTQKPLRERLERMYGVNGEVRDRLTDYSNPASGAFYFAPSVEVLDQFAK